MLARLGIRIVLERAILTKMPLILGARDAVLLIAGLFRRLVALTLATCEILQQLREGLSLRPFC